MTALELEISTGKEPSMPPPGPHSSLQSGLCSSRSCSSAAWVPAARPQGQEG